MAENIIKKNKKLVFFLPPPLSSFKKISKITTNREKRHA
ncbi:hypothetical protein DSUL_60312 [Desulfovibrionales bacterium]